VSPARPRTTAYQNADHVAKHGISDLEIDRMLSNRHLVIPNSGHEPRMFLLGQTDGGRILTVVIEPTRIDGTWRPITAWDASDSEKTRLTPRKRDCEGGHR
jgi:uncharacterized DUF497 family protein